MKIWSHEWSCQGVKPHVRHLLKHWTMKTSEKLLLNVILFIQQMFHLEAEIPEVM